MQPRMVKKIQNSRHSNQCLTFKHQ